MRIFLSYAWQDREQAKSVHLALRDQGHQVFFDQADLQAGDEYHNRIRKEIEHCHLFVFLITPLALDAGSYTLTELDVADKSARKLLPVLLPEGTIENLPPVLKSVTVLRPDGNIAASVAAEVHRIATHRRRVRLKRGAVALCVVGVMAGGIFYGLDRRHGAEVVGRDGAPAVLVPAGNFVMGDDENSPRREIYVDGFYIDRYEVTIGRYAKFLEATGGHKKPDDWPEGDLKKFAEFPVVGVDWHDADSYCRWAGKRLPTEAEWEKSARGTDARKYPWGAAEPTSAHARFTISSRNAVYPDGISQIGKYPDGIGPFGTYDLAGNASEWVADWYAPGFSWAQLQNPKGPDTGTSKVIRGGGWMDPPDRISTTRRMYLGPNQRMEDIGFRCATDVP